MKTQRNDPCPCGSGRKYKHCCLAAAVDASPEQLTWRRVRRALEGFAPRMLDFIHDTYGPDALYEAWDEFMVPGLEAEEFDPDSPHLQLFFSWFHHFWSPDPYDTVLENESLHDQIPTQEFLQRRGRNLDATLRDYLQACLVAPLSFHEVRRCDPGIGFVSLDLFTGEEHTVIERGASTTLQPNEIIFGQIVRVQGIAMLEACSPFGLRPIDKIVILDMRERIQKRWDVLTPEVIRDYDGELIALYLSLAEAVLNPTLPQLCNTDGHVLSPQQLIFDIDSPEACFDALRTLAHEGGEDVLQSVQRDRTGAFTRASFNWTKAGNAQNPGWNNTVLGSIVITRKRLTCDLNSDERAAELRGLVEQRLGSGARFRFTKMQSIEAALAKGPEKVQSPAELAAMEKLQQEPAVIAEMQRLLTAHYDSWPQQPLPALDGQTPEQAVRDPLGREKVEALLRDFEFGAARGLPAFDPAIVARLRERLGLAAATR